MPLPEAPISSGVLGRICGVFVSNLKRQHRFYGSLLTVDEVTALDHEVLYLCGHGQCGLGRGTRRWARYEGLGI